jgi:Polyketide cyclase / dehydrase and lipid transport
MNHMARAEVESSASIETVWPLLSTVSTWPMWSRHKLARLERGGSPTPDGVGAIRVLGGNPQTSAKCNREEVVAFEARPTSATGCCQAPLSTSTAATPGATPNCFDW